MDKDAIDRLARIETKLDLIVPHFEPENGSIGKLMKMRAEYNILKKLLGAAWGGLLAYLYAKK